MTTSEKESIIIFIKRKEYTFMNEIKRSKFCHIGEIIIEGKTMDGKKFRPSDWDERLCGILSNFSHGKLEYHDYVRPVIRDGVHGIAVDESLEQYSPEAFKFIMDFAQDNNLQIHKCMDW